MLDDNDMLCFRMCSDLCQICGLMYEVIKSTIRLNHLPCHNITKELHDGLLLKKEDALLKKLL